MMAGTNDRGSEATAMGEGAGGLGPWPGFGWDIATGVFLAVVWGLVVYRAITWSVTCDEALTYNTFLTGGWRHLFLYGANNHVLFTWLAKISITVFGLAPWSLRLPAIMAAAIYLGCTGWLARRWFSGPWKILAAGLLAINPLMMDYLVAARGYGLACALLLVAEALVLLPVESTTDSLPQNRRAAWRRRMIGGLCALTIAANLAFTPAAVAVGCVALRRTRFKYWLQLILPGLLLGVILLGAYLPQFGRNRIQVGFPSLQYTAIDLWNGSMHHEALAQISWFEVLHRLRAPANVHTRTGLIATSVGASLLCLCVGVCIWRRGEARSARTAAAMALVIAVGVIILLHLVTHLPYPVDRTALFLLPMGTLAALLMGMEAALPVRNIAAIIGMVVLCIYARQIDSRCFEYARYDAGAGPLFAAMEADAQGRFQRPVRLGGTWIYEPSMNFYRALHHANWLMPMERDYGNPQPSQYDYFIAHPQDYRQMNWNAYRLIATDAVSGTRLIAAK